jgi:hypothetical protein
LIEELRDFKKKCKSAKQVALVADETVTVIRSKIFVMDFRD